MSRLQGFYLFILVFYICLAKLVANENSNSICKPPWDLEKITSCAIENHPTYKMENMRLREVQGRKKIASYFFPSNPNLYTNLANRSTSGSTNIVSNAPTSAHNFQLMVTQEVYVGGKREKSIQIADEEFRSQVMRLETIKRNLYFQSISSVIRFLNAKKEEELSESLFYLSQNLTKVAKARVREGIAPGIDETLAEAEELRMAKILKNASRKVEQTKVEVFLLLSLPIDTSWNWSPSFNLRVNLPREKEEILNFALRNRPEISLSENEIKLAILRYEEVRLQKIPNLSFGAFVQNDGFNERVIGGHVSLPLTVWRDFEGESIVSKSKSEQSIQNKEIMTRNVKQEVINALSNYLILNEEMKLYDSSLLERSERNLENITNALTQGKLKVIDAINNQRILVQTKLNFIQTKSDFDQAQVELVRALGLPIDQLSVAEQQ